MNDFTGRVKPDDRKPPSGRVRTYHVALDTAQYQMDINRTVAAKSEDIYSTFNLVMRRDPKVRGGLLKLLLSASWPSST